MATNLCAECGTRLPRPEYKAHMQEVHGVSVMNDSDDEREDSAQAEGVAAEAPRPQRERPRRAVPKSDSPADTPVTEGDAPQGPEDGSSKATGGPGGTRQGRRGGRSDDKAGGPRGEFACADCGRSFDTSQGLMRHTQAKHPDSENLEVIVAAAATEPRPGPTRRGGSSRGPAADGVADSSGNAPAPAAATRRAPRSRGPRGGGRAPAASAPAAAADSMNVEAVAAAAAAASAAAAAALEGSPTPAAEARPERLVTLFRCTVCQQGFKSKNRAHSHVTEAHPEEAPPAPAAEGEAAAAATDAAAAGGPKSADTLLEEVQVPTRRAPRPSNRRGRRPAASAAAVANGKATEGEKLRTGVRRGGRPPKKSSLEAQADAAAVPEAEVVAGLASDTSAAAQAPTANGEGPAAELAALGIVSSS